MKRHEIEALTLDVADRVSGGQPIEDTRIELKRTWTDPKDAAAQIAAHANASRGAPIVWLLGVDERAHAIPGVADREFADWWAQIKREFDGDLVPELDNSPVAVPTHGVTVVAVAMDTTRPPYVVKNPDGGRLGYWVPWREGNATRAARHADLLRILVPAQVLPEVEILSGSVQAHDYTSDEEEGTVATQWSVSIVFYAAVPGLGSIVFPAHRVRATLHLSADADPALELVLRRMGPQQWIRGRPHPLMDVSQEQLVLRGAGSIHVELDTVTPAGAYEELGPVRIAIELGSPTSDLPVAFDVTLAPELARGDRDPRWTFSRDMDTFKTNT